MTLATCCIAIAFLLPTNDSAKKPARKLPAAAKATVAFRRDIAPIFAKHCVSCHGPTHQESGLRLDVRDNVMAGGDNGAIFEVGKSAESSLVTRIAGLEEDGVMPPEGEKLTDEQIALVRAWIDQGAQWPESGKSAAGKADHASVKHWSFQPVKRPEVPNNLKKRDWVRSPIDAFILQKLEKEGISPSEPAERGTLIRRLSLDLLGLLPTADEVKAFEDDKRPDAYERLVDRLLASPHFGERWGRHWLDLARYADSDGYEKDLPRPYAWRYRNWVIDAINADMPYDQFTIRQLAGDLLPNSTLDDTVATGFHRNTLTNREGGVDQEEFRVNAVIDRTNTTGTVWLGLTVGCAQCHTHKYDPIAHREYYSLFAFFNNADEKDVSAPLPAENAEYEKKLADYKVAHAQLEKKVAEFEPQLAARQAEWESMTLSSGKAKAWKALEPAGFLSAAGANFKILPDLSILVSGFLPEKDDYTVVVRTKVPSITALRLETFNDSSLPGGGPGRSDVGNFVLNEFSVQVAPSADPTKPRAVALHSPTTDFEQTKFPIANAIDGNVATGWSIGGYRGRLAARSATFTAKDRISSAAGVTLTFTLKQGFGKKHQLGRFRLLATDAEPSELPNLLPENIFAALSTTPDRRSPEQKKDIASYYRTIDAEMSKRVKAVLEHEQRMPEPPKTLAQTLDQRDADPRKTHVHIRGDFLRKGIEVKPGSLAALSPLKARTADADRLDLARWIVDPANPLPSRVAANRIWQHLFGRGIVLTTEDFGTQGDPPSHPELLDFLASEYIARGWSLKSMIREIVCSSTYQQSSKAREDLVDKDPKNAWLARQNRYRIEAEVVRDLYLSASGLLNTAIGGPSVRPPLPSGVAELGYAGSVKWELSKGADKYRRGMYIFFQRTVPYPMLTTFDTPDSNVTCTRRERSNTPLQALTLLNDPVFFECSQALGKRIAADKPANWNEAIRRAYRYCVTREPTPHELERLGKLVAELEKLAKQNPREAAKLAGDEKLSDADAVAGAVRVGIARVLLNLDEFFTRE